MYFLTPATRISTRWPFLLFRLILLLRKQHHIIFSIGNPRILFPSSSCPEQSIQFFIFLPQYITKNDIFFQIVFTSFCWGTSPCLHTMDAINSEFFKPFLVSRVYPIINHRLGGTHPYKTFSVWGLSRKVIHKNLLSLRMVTVTKPLIFRIWHSQTIEFIFTGTFH